MNNAFAPYKLSPNQFHMTFPEGQTFYSSRRVCFLRWGDNRDQSSDSRTWGPVSVNDIKGQAFMVYWSYDAFNQKRPWEVWKIVNGIRFTRIGSMIRSEFNSGY